MISFENRLKKEMSEGIVRAVLDDAGYRVVDSGIEKVLREVTCMPQSDYVNLNVPRALRRLPDLVVMNREQTEIFMIEVKYRSQVGKELFQEVREQVGHFEQIVLVTIHGNPPNPRSKHGLPSLHLRCCRVRHQAGQLQVELSKRHVDGSGPEWANADELSDENLWWRMSPLQDIFVQVQDRRDDRTLLSAINAISGIIGN